MIGVRILYLLFLWLRHNAAQEGGGGAQFALLALGGPQSTIKEYKITLFNCFLWGGTLKENVAPDPKEG